MYIRFPLSLRNVEDLLHERGIDVSYESVRFWWNRFGPAFASEIKKRRGERLRAWPGRCWRLDEMVVKIGGEQHYLWRAIDDEGEVLEAYAAKTRDRKAALKFLRKALKHAGRPGELVTDGLRSYGAAMSELGLRSRRRTGRWLNNRVENSHQPLRRRERAMSRFRRMRSLQKSAAVHSSVHSHFNQECSLYRRANVKALRTAALDERRQLGAA